MLKIYFCLLFFLFGFAINLIGQQPFSFKINDENGLPSNEIYQVLQDNFGFMWIACDAGLFRYDGFEFKQYKSANQNGRSISGLQLDQQGRVWCRNFNGQVYRVEGNLLKTIANVSQNTSNNNYTLDNNGNAWIVCANELIHYTDQGKKLKVTYIPHCSPNKNTISDIVFFNGQLFLCHETDGILVYINGKFKSINQDSFSLKSAVKNTFFIQKDQLKVLSEELSGKRYFIHSIESFALVKTEAITPELSSAILYKICATSENETWLCTSAGALKKPLNTVDNENLYTILPTEKISNVIKDREGMYWLSTLTEGIFVIPSLEVLSFSPENANLSSKNVTAIAKIDSEQLLIGMNSGLVDRFSISTRKCKPIQLSSNLKFQTTKCIATYKGKTYIAHGQLTVLKSGTYNALPFYNIRDFVIHQDTLFYVTSSAVVKIAMSDVDKGDQSKIRFIKSTGGRNVKLDQNTNTLFFNLNNGVYSYAKNRWTALKYRGKSIFASSIVFQNKVLWIASISNGLLVYKQSKIQKPNSNITNSIEGELKLINASSNYIWACGNTNLYRISIYTNEVVCYSKNCGINAAEITGLNVFENHLYISSNKGLLVIRENFNPSDRSIPHIEISAITQSNKRLPINKEILLTYRHKNVIIHLASTSFKSRADFFYQYRIAGLDNDWIKIPVQNKSIILSNIPSGKFSLEIKSISAFGIESRLITIPIVVESPIWQKWWFYLLVCCSIIIIIGIFFTSRMRYLRKKTSIQEKLIASQLTALKAQMNPHFIFNALNSIQDLVLENDIKNSNLYLSKFSMLMRKILDISGQERIPIYDEIDLLTIYLELEKLRFGSEFQFSISCSSAIDPYALQIPGLIIQPFVENAIKHGLLHKKGKKELQISFDLDTQIICTITDNGIGRKHANEISIRRTINHRSFATSATEKRIELLNAIDKKNYSIEIQDLVNNGIAVGTKVILRMPV